MMTYNGAEKLCVITCEFKDMQEDNPITYKNNFNKNIQFFVTLNLFSHEINFESHDA